MITTMKYNKICDNCGLTFQFDLEDTEIDREIINNEQHNTHYEKDFFSLNPFDFGPKEVVDINYNTYEIITRWINCPMCKELIYVGEFDKKLISSSVKKNVIQNMVDQCPM